MTKPLQRIVGAVTLFSFVVTNSVWGMPQAGIEVLSSRETPGFFHIEIPDNLASIEEIYEAPAKPDPRLILHIQNAHGNYEAQSKIKDLLDYLYKTYGFKLIFVEGAAEPLNADYMRLFPDAERNMQLADYFAQKGELTGAELYLMNAPGDVKAIGIEKTELYRANYDAFKKVYGAKSDSDNFLAGTSAKLERLASRFYSPEARQLLSEWGKFEEGHREFLPYVKKLSLDAKKALGLDLESIFAQVEWPQITRLLVIQSMEKDLNRETALTERARLVEFLKSKRVSEEVLKSVETFEEKKITMNRASADPESYRNSPRYLLERLVEEAGPKGFYFHDYPAFSLYAGYLILKSELDSKNLFKEIEILFDKILTELTKTELEKNLLELFRDQKLLTKLMHLELNREEWQRAVYRREWIKPDAMNERIKHLESGKISVDMIQGPGEAELKPLAEIFATAFSFYELAHERESVFYQTLRDEMSNSKSEKAVLITGGFHTDGLMELFREDEVSFSTLMPRLTQKPETDNYIATMMETRKTIFDTANLEEVLRQITEGTRFGQGANRVSPHGEVQGMVLAILEIAQRTNTTEAEAREILANLGQTAYGQDRQASVEENSDHVSIVRHRGESVGGLRLIPGNPFAYSRADVKTGPVVLTQNSVKATLGMLGQKAEAQKGRLIPQAKTTAAASEMRTNLQSYNVDVRWLSGASAQTGYHVTVGDKTATGFTSEQLAASLERVIAEIFGEGKFSAQTPTPYELTFSVIDISSGKIFSADSRKESEVQSALQKAVDLLSVLTTIESTPRRLLVGGRGIQRPDGPFMKQLNQLPPISSDDEEDRAASEIRATSFKKWTLTALLIGAVGFTAASYGYIAYLAYPPKASNQELAKRSFNRQRAYQMGYTALTPVRWVTNLFGVPEDGLSQWFDRKARNQFIETRVFNAGAIEDWNRELNEDLNKLRQSEMRVSNLPSDSQLRKPKIFKTFVIAATFLASALGIGSGIAYYQTRLADPPNASAEELQNRSKNRLKFYGDIYSELKPVRTLVQEVANNPNIVDPVSFLLGNQMENEEETQRKFLMAEVARAQRIAKATARMKEFREVFKEAEEALEVSRRNLEIQNRLGQIFERRFREEIQRRLNQEKAQDSAGTGVVWTPIPSDIQGESASPTSKEPASLRDIKELNRESLQRAVREYHEAQLKMREIQLKARSGFFPQSEMRKPMSWGKGLLITTAVVGVLALSMGGGLYFKHLAGSPKLTYEESLRRNENWQQVYGTVRNALKPVRWMTDRWFRVAEDPLSLWLGEQERRYFLKGIILRLEAYDTTDRRFPPAMTLQQAEYLETVKRTLPTAEDLATPPKSSKSSAETLREIEERNKRQASKAMEEYQKALRRNYSERGISQSELRGVAEIIPDDPEKWPAYFLNRAMVLAQGVRDAGGPAEAVLLADRAADLLKKVQKDFEIVDQDGLARIIIPLLFQKDIQGVIDYLSEALSLLSSHHVQLLDEERELVVRTAQAFVQIGFESSLQDERNRQIVEQTIMSANLVMLLPGAISALFGTGARISEIVIVGQKARSESRTGKNEKKTSIGRILLKEVGFYGAVLGLVGTIAPLLLIGGHFLFGNKEPQVAPEANQAESTIQEVASTPPSPTRVQLLMDKIKNLKLDDATRLEAARELGRMIHKAEEDGNPQLAQEITDQFYEFFVWLSSDQFLPMVNNGSRFKQTSIYLWPAIWKDSDGIWHVHVIPADGGESYDAFAYVEAFATSPRAFEAFIKMLNAPIAADNFYMPYFGGQGAGLYPGQKSQKALESAIREREQLEKEPQSLGERKSNAIIRDFYKTRLEKVKSMPPFSEMRKPMSFKKLTLIVALLSAVVGISGTAYFYQTLLADLPNASPTERENRSWNRGIAYLKAYEMMLPTRKLSNAIFGQDDYLSAWLLARAKVNQIDEEGNLVRVVQFAPSKLWANPEVTVTTYEYEREDGASIPKKVTFSQSELRSEKTEKRTAEELARGDFNASASDGSRGGIRFLLGTLWRGLQGFPFYSFLSQFVSGGYSRIASVASRIMEITSPTARSEPRVNTAQFVKASIEYLRHLATDSNATLWGSSTSDRTHNPVQLLNHVLSPAIAKENQRATSDKKPPQEFLLQIAEQLIDRIGEIATDIFAEEYDAAHKGDMLWLTGGPMRDLRTLAGEVADQIKREIVVEEGSAANGKTNLGWFVRIDENIIASSGPSEYKLQFMTREVNALFEKFAAQLENKNSIRSEMRQNLIDQMMARLPSEIVTPVVYIALAGVAGYAAYQIWSTSRRPAEEQSRSIEDGVKNVLEILRERNFNEAIVSDKDFSDAVTDVYRTYKPYQLSDGAIADEILVSLGLRDIRSLSPDEVAAIIGQGLEEYPRPSLEITTVFFALSSYENLPQGVLYPDSPVYQAVSDFYASRRLNGSSLQDIIDELDSLLRGAGMGPHAAPQLVANVIRGVNQSELRQYEVILTNKELFQGILLAESFRQQLEDLAREFNSPEYVKKPAQEAIQGLLKADSDNRNGAARIARAKRLFLITAISQFGSTEARKPLADYFAWNGLGEKKFPLVAKFLNLVGKAMTVASHSELRSQEPPDFSAYFIPETLTTKNGWPESFRIRIDERYDEGSKERFDVDVLFSLNTDKDKSDRLDLKSPPRKLVYYITMPSRPPKEVSIDLNAAGVVETVAFDMSTTGMSLKLLVRIEAWLEKLKNGVPFNDKHPVFQGSEAPEVKEPDLQNSTLQSSLERILRQRYVSRVDIMAILSEADQLKKYKQTQNIDQIQFGEWGVREEGRLKFGEGEERLNAFQLDVKPPRLGDAEIESQLESLRETLQKFMPAYAIEFIKDFSGNGVLRLQFTWRVQKRNIKGLESKSDDATKVPITWNYSLNRGQEDWTITLNETSKTALKRPDPRLELTYEVQSTTTLRPIGTVRLAMSAKIGPDGSRTIDPKSEIKYTGYLSEWRRDTKTPEHSTWLEFNNFMQVARQSPWGFELKDRKKNLNPDILNIVLEPIDRIARQSEMRQTGPEIIGAIGIGVLAISALWGVNRLMLAERLKRASQTKFEYRPDNRSGVWRVEAGYKTFFATDAELRLKLGDYGVEITPKIEQDIADAKRNPIRQTSQSEMRQIEPEIIISAIGIGLVAGAILWADKRLRIAKGLERASKTKFEYRPGKGGGDWLVEVGYQTFVATDGELRSKLELYGVKITPKIERDIEAAKRNFVRQTSQSELRTEDEDKKELVRMAAGLSVREKPSTADEKNIIAGIILQARKAEALTPLQIKPLEQPEPSRVGEDRFQVEPLLREIGNRDRGIDGVEMLIFNDIQTGARAFNPATRSFEEAILPQLTVFLGVIELENLENDGKVHEYALLESPYQDKTHFLVRRSVIKKSQIELIRVDSGYGMRRIAFAPSTALPGALIRSPKVDLGDLILKDFGRTNLIHLPPMRGGLDLIEIGGARREIAAEAGVTVRITIHVSDEKIVTKEFRIKAGGTLGHILAQLPPQMPVLIAEVQGKDFQKRPLNFDEVLRPGDTVDLILYPNEMFTSEEESFYAKITAQKPLPMTKLNMDPILARIPESEKLGTLVSVEGADTAAPFIIFRVEIRTNVAAILRSMRFSLYNVIIAAVLLGETSLNLSSELEPGQEIRIQFGPRRPLKPAAPAPVSPITWPTTTVRPPASSESSNMNASRETEQHPLAKLPQRLEITSAPVVQQWVLPSTPRVGTSRSEMRTPDLSTVSSPAYVGYNEGNRKVAVTLEDRTEIMEVLTARFKELSAGKSFNEDKFDKEFLEFFNTAWGKSRLQSLKVIPSSSALIRGLAQISQDNLIYELIPNSGPATAEIENLAKKAGVRKIYFVFNKSGWLTAFGIWMDIVSPAERNLIAQRVSQRETQQVITRTVEAQRVTPWESLLTYLSEKAGVVRSGKEKTIARDFFITRKGFDVAGALTDHSKWEQVDDPVVLQQLEGIFARLPVKKFQRAAGFKVQAGTPLSDVEAALRLLHGNSKHEIATSDPAFRWSRRRSSLDGLQTETGEIVQWVEQWLNEGEIQKTTQHRIIYTLHRRTNGSKIVEISKKGDSVRFTSTGWTDIVGQISDPPSRLEFAHKLEKILAQPSSRTKKDRDWKYLYDMELTNRTKRVYYRVIGKTILFVAAYKREDLNTYTSDGPKSKLRDLSNAAPNALLHDAFSVEDSVQKLQDNFPIKFIGANSEMRDIERIPTLSTPGLEALSERFQVSLGIRPAILALDQNSAIAAMPGAAIPAFLVTLRTGLITAPTLSVEISQLVPIAEMVQRATAPVVDQTFTPAIDFLTARWSKPTKVTREQTFPLGIRIGGDDNAVVQDWVDAALADGRVKWLVVTGPNARAINQYLDQIQQAGRTVTTVGNMNTHRGDGVYDIPVMEANNPQPLRNPNVVQIGISDSEGIKTDPSLKRMEILLQARLAVAMLEKRPNGWNAVSSAEIRPLLKEVSRVLLPGLHADVLKGRIENTPNGPRLIVTVSRSEFRTYLQRLTRVLESKKLVGKAA